MIPSILHCNFHFTFPSSNSIYLDPHTIMMNARIYKLKLFWMRIMDFIYIQSNRIYCKHHTYYYYAVYLMWNDCRKFEIIFSHAIANRTIFNIVSNPLDFYFFFSHSIRRYSILCMFVRRTIWPNVKSWTKEMKKNNTKIITKPKATLKHNLTDRNDDIIRERIHIHNVALQILASNDILIVKYWSRKCLLCKKPRW